MHIILQFGLQCGAVFRAQGLDLSLGLYRQQLVLCPDATPQSLDFKNCLWIVFLPCFELFFAAELWGWMIKQELNVSFWTCGVPALLATLCPGWAGAAGGGLVSGDMRGSMTASAGLRWVTAALQNRWLVACGLRAMCESPSLVIGKENTHCK